MPYELPYHGKRGEPIWPTAFMAAFFLWLFAALTANYATTSSWKPGPYQLMAFGLAAAFAVLGVVVLALGVRGARNYLKQRKLKAATLAPRDEGRRS